jgi:chaperonin cofactor prefoldin
MQRQRQAAAARMLAQRLTWEQVAAPLVRFCRMPEHTRPQPATAPPAPVAPAEAPPNPPPDPPPDTYRLLEESRNAAVAVQEQTWNIQEQMPSTGRLAPARQQVVQQVVRPYMVPLLEQQRTYNIAVLRSLYAINQLNDHQRHDLLQTINLHHDLLQTINHRMTEAEQRFDPLELRTQTAEKRVGVLQGQMGAVEKHIGTLQGQVGAVEKHIGTLQGQVAPLETLRERVERLEHNNRALRQLLSELVEQISGLEDAGTRLLVALRALLDQQPEAESQTTEQEQP